MKKLTTVLIAAGLIATASACSAQQQLTTAETCDRVGVVAAGIPQSQSKTAANRVANAMRPIEPVASSDMKPVVTAITEYMDELSKETPDEAKLGELGQAYQEAGTKYGELCRAQ
ncbi:hypothetical protein [Paenarthrobacter ilicis]|uniref:Uncharacterized protein n=1 Tax=Paenarthrobacter ilicis TaxID=43665 RepID=A0ABX0TIH8_9MICC|nr:hypothetical protein [Paenarthrobacter ilicis]MBM7794530.1 hypothetical protein [Paenarthrobacter ilicis]NIJ02354.1 hypothetical protein [Paenarthrobacter ilicis]